MANDNVVGAGRDKPKGLVFSGTGRRPRPQPWRGTIRCRPRSRPHWRQEVFSLVLTPEDDEGGQVTHDLPGKLVANVEDAQGAEPPRDQPVLSYPTTGDRGGVHPTGVWGEVARGVAPRVTARRGVPRGAACRNEK